jgi:hypothetical protein
MKAKIELALVGTVALIVVMVMGLAWTRSVPQLINYQGRLADAAGQPVDGQTVDITFSFYGQAAGGTAYLSVLQEDVLVTAGQYNVLIGSGTIVPGAAKDLSDLFSKHKDVWMGVKVDADAEMTPRARITSAPYSLTTDMFLIGQFVGVPDWDQDGFKKGPYGGNTVDCNDADTSTHPGAYDAPNDGIDQDCDGFDTKSCSLPSECASGLCVDGFCCASACGGACQSCGRPGAEGKCVMVPAGQDPEAECLGSGGPLANCGGSCNGAGACTYVMSDWSLCDEITECSMQTQCTYSENHWYCNNGACTDGGWGNTDCTPYACSLSGCKSSCNSDADCCAGAGEICNLDNNTCIHATRCTAPGQCASGYCVDGYCCDASCDTECMGCNVPGHEGGCSPLPEYGFDSACKMNGQDFVCAMDAHCDGNGHCNYQSSQGRSCPYLSPPPYPDSQCQGVCDTATGWCNFGAVDGQTCDYSAPMCFAPYALAAWVYRCDRGACSFDLYTEPILVEMCSPYRCYVQPAYPYWEYCLDSCNSNEDCWGFNCNPETHICE